MKKKGGKKKRKKRSFFIWKYLLLTVLFFSIILFYVWERVERLEVGYKIMDKKETKRKLIEEREPLLLETVRLKSPQRLERVAIEELGLIAPTGGKSIRRIVVSQ